MLVPSLREQVVQMCFSAQVVEAFELFKRKHGAEIDIHEFVKLYGNRSEHARIRIPKGMDANFANPATDAERSIASMISQFNSDELARHEQELFKQRKRLADAERKLLVRTTKAATESRRIATSKVQWLLSRISDIKRTAPAARDSRIFPGSYTAVMVSEKGRRVVRPMRYQCRPQGKPAFYDTRYPGTYNARRDNLEGFWKGQFGLSHGIMIASAFYENVSRHDLEGRQLNAGEEPENVILEFRPTPVQDMLVACLWSRWQSPGEDDLLSFAAITDEPPAEIAAAGHDRCIIPIKPEHVDAWLNPDPRNLPAMYEILDDREHPYYEHRMAA
jgi:putative SOS response-associated peptidase YedK